MYYTLFIFYHASVIYTWQSKHAWRLQYTMAWQWNSFNIIHLPSLSIIVILTIWSGSNNSRARGEVNGLRIMVSFDSTRSSSSTDTTVVTSLIFVTESGATLKSSSTGNQNKMAMASNTICDRIWEIGLGNKIHFDCITYNKIKLSFLVHFLV